MGFMKLLVAALMLSAVMVADDGTSVGLRGPESCAVSGDLGYAVSSVVEVAQSSRRLIFSALLADDPDGCCCLWKTSTVKDCTGGTKQAQCKQDAKDVSVGERYTWHSGACKSDEK